MSQHPTFTSLSLNEAKPEEGVLTVNIYVNDKMVVWVNDPDPPGKFRLLSIWIRKEVNKIGKAEINLKAWSEIKADEESDSDDEYFTPGNFIRIETGYFNTSTEKSIFEGIIIAQQMEIDTDSETSLKIECRDCMYPSTMVPKTRVHKDVDDKKLLSLLVGEYGHITPSIGQTNNKPQDITQFNMSDWDLILQRARANNFCVITEGSKMVVDKPALAGAPAFTLRFGDNIIGIKGKMQASKQLSKVQVLAWNSKQQKLMNLTVSKVEENDQGEISPSALAKKIGDNELILTTSEFTDDYSIKKWAEAKLQESSLKRTQGDITCKGTAAIKAGCIVEIVEVGKHFDGSAYCGAVEHEVRDGKWLTTVCMGYPESVGGDGNEISSENTTAIKGMQIGKVVQIHQDPSKEYNILAELPLFKGDQPNTVWSRFATFWASSQYGAFFFPDPGDEVVVGFFDNDTNKPVIMGSLYSSKQSPSTTPEKNNNIRNIVTRSGMKLEFEEAKKSVTIETPGKNIIEISDDGKSIRLMDQNNNKIEMTEGGISIESARSINLKAKTDITIEAGTSIDMKGKSAINLKSANIEAKADLGFTAKGGAKAELSAGGQTVVKGALVMIN